MPPLAYFGIESSGLDLLIDLLILFAVVLYLSLIYWTYSDARRRILDPILVGCATAASLFPFVGTIIYLILRPPEYLEDVHERELELQAAEARVHELERGLCPYCDDPVEADFVRCPSCLRKLKERCVSCSRPLEQSWTICPYCETEVPGVPASRRARRRRSGALGGDRGDTGEATGELGAALAEDERSGFGQPATRAGEEGPRSAPVAASEPTAPPHSSAGRARRPRPTP